MILAKITYPAKIWFSRHGPKNYSRIRLPDSLTHSRGPSMLYLFRSKFGESLGKTFTLLQWLEFVPLLSWRYNSTGNNWSGWFIHAFQLGAIYSWASWRFLFIFLSIYRVTGKKVSTLTLTAYKIVIYKRFDASAISAYTNTKEISKDTYRKMVLSLGKLAVSFFRT